MRTCGICEAEIRREDYGAHMARHRADGWVDLPPPQKISPASVEAVWCLCGREAYIVLIDNEVVCPFCFLTQMVENGNLEPERADRVAAILQAKRAEEDRRLVRIVEGTA